MYNNEWLELNAHRKYPIMHECSMKDMTRKFTLPTSLFVDVVISVNQDYQNIFYVSKVSYSSELFSVIISMGADKIEALIGSIQSPDPANKNQVLNLYGKDAYQGSYGKLVIGNLSEMMFGTFEFFPNDTMIEPCRVIRLSTGISSINGISSGNINLISGTNVVITKTGNQIKIDTVDGLCACQDVPCIKTINGIQPVNNNFKIAGTGCVQVEPIEGGIKITNTCESACCGCDEINDFMDRMLEMEKRIAVLEALLG